MSCIYMYINILLKKSGLFNRQKYGFFYAIL